MEVYFKNEIKIFPKWVKHKTIDHLICVLLFIVIYVQYNKNLNNSITTEEKLVDTYWSLNKLLIIFCIYILPTPYIKRPFRFLWKLCQSALFVYMINLLILVFLDKQTIWSIFNKLDHNLPGPKDEKSYAADCRIYTPENQVSYFFNIYDSIDVYVLTHWAGWFVKGFIFRNSHLLWFSSIGFEFLEITLKYYFPNFQECWWDSILLDVLGMNLIGIVLSWYIIKKFKVKKYHWIIEPLNNKYKKDWLSRLKFFFKSISYYNSINKFHIFSSLGNYWTIVYIWAFNFLTDLNNFFNKYVLRIPSSHFFLKYRIFIIGFSAIIVYSDIYVYSHGKNPNHKLPISIYLSNVVFILEVLLFYNNLDYNEFSGSIPLHIKFIWSIIFSLIILLGIFSYYNGKYNKIVKFN